MQHINTHLPYRNSLISSLHPLKLNLTWKKSPIKKNNANARLATDFQVTYKKCTTFSYKIFDPLDCFLM